MSIKTVEKLGYLGIIMMVGVVIYLTLKILGIFHSPALEDVLLTTTIAQLFYVRYNHRALKEIERRVGFIETRLIKIG